MFQFPEFALLTYGFSQQCMASTAMRVTPFGNPRIKRCLLFPEAYRSWPRPSSLPRAKASALRPYYLTLTVKIVNPWRPSHLLLSHQNLRFYCPRKKIYQAKIYYWSLPDKPSKTTLLPILVEDSGVEPLTSCLQSRRSTSWANPPSFYHTRNLPQKNADS